MFLTLQPVCVLFQICIHNFPQSTAPKFQDKIVYLHNKLGTGIWAIDFGNDNLVAYLEASDKILANQFPSANVIGTDLSPIQPDL